MKKTSGEKSQAKLKASSSHWGNYTHNIETLGYKALVITGPIQGQDGLRFGMVVQVRKKSGAFGSDTVLLREADGKLESYHNMGFFSVALDFLPIYEKAMMEVANVDKEGATYSIMGRNPASGFVVEGLDDTNGDVWSIAITTIKKTAKITGWLTLPGIGRNRITGGREQS